MKSFKFILSYQKCIVKTFISPRRKAEETRLVDLNTNISPKEFNCVFSLLVI